MPIRREGGGGAGGGGGLLFRTPTDIFTGADLAACRTARNAYFVSPTNASALLNQFKTDQFLTIVLDPADSTDNVFETYLPGNADGVRQKQEFSLAAANATARGMTVNATYAYVVDDATERVYVYRLSGGARQASKEFPIHSTNTWPVGIGVDATDAYVADRTHTKVFVYQLSDGRDRQAKSSISIQITTTLGAWTSMPPMRTSWMTRTIRSTSTNSQTGHGRPLVSSAFMRTTPALMAFPSTQLCVRRGCR